MLKVYSGKLNEIKFTQEGSLLRNLDVRFPYWFYAQREHIVDFKFSKQALEFLEDIEHVYPRNEECTKFSSQFGDRVCIDDFSYGARSFLSILYDISPGSVYEMTSAGPNIWSYLFKECANLDRKIFSEYFPAIDIPTEGLLVNELFCQRSGDAFIAFREGAGKI